ncbi:MAG: D-alanine--D-alanine ligase family protein, partial [Nostoc sp.]
RISLPEAIQFIMSQNIDLVIPHMYCIPGMTYYRALFDLLKISYIGNTPDVMAIAAHKGKTKAIVAAAGVKVPFGELLRQGDVPTIPPPSIVKPTSAANSMGVSLVKE